MTRKSISRLQGKLAGLASVAVLAWTSGMLAAQQPIQAPAVADPASSGAIPPAPASTAASSKVPSGVTPPAHYILGPNDEIQILATHADELSNKSYRISTSGDLNLPQVGRIHAEGMTAESLEAVVIERLKVIIKEPDVVINITQFKSQPISVFGEVGTPGIHQVEGRKTLIEVLSLAGGTKVTAGSRVKITREIATAGTIPLPSATTEDGYSMAEVNVSTLASRPSDNIQILAKDIISVPKADIVYVIGEVHRPGGFVLVDRRTITVFEALARADGPGPTAKKKDAQIIRQMPGADLLTIPVNLDDVLKNKALNVMMQPDDILYVPDNYAKGLARKTFENVIQTALGVAIFR